MTVVRLLRDRFVIGLLATAAIALGIFALLYPVRLDAHDRWGAQIVCGTGIVSDHAQAETTGGVGFPDGALVLDPTVHTDYVARCDAATWWRRGWAVTLIVPGAVVSAVLLRASHRRETGR